MEPQLPRPSSEMGPLPTSGEIKAPSSPELVPSRVHEQAPSQETREGLRSSPGVGDPAFVAPTLPPPQVVQAVPSNPVPIVPPVVDDNPIVASDEDLIEKAWVDKAKKIVSTTKNDPYLQEQEVSRLQADYLKKRYGKEVKLPIE